MTNPFVAYLDRDEQIAYLTEDCSINKMIIAKLPVYGFEDDIEGLSAKEVFSTKIIARLIRENAEALGIDVEERMDLELPKMLENVCENTDSSKSGAAKRLLLKIGHRLGIILLTLKTGLVENRNSRPQWSNAHWDYWKNIKTIVLVGGLTNGIFGQYLKKCVDEVFYKAGVEPYVLRIYDSASHFGTMGCMKLIHNEAMANVVFDLGQTNTKRCIVFSDVYGDRQIRPLPNIPSAHVEFLEPDSEEELEEANKLHNQILEVVANTYMEASKEFEVGNEIVISMANYLCKGRLNRNRGGYAKLSRLSKNHYDDYLSKDLSSLIGEEIIVRLIHDGTAVAINFTDERNLACISLGTGFGVGFPVEM